LLQLPTVLAGEPTLASNPDKALHSALVSVNSQLHASPVDDSLSGTTACCAVLQGRTLYIANVGDSRAVVAERPAAGSKAASEGSEGAGSSSGSGATELVARDLSQDQTPFRLDECHRVLQAGARVLTLDQLEGLKDPGLPCWTNEADCDGDPPRLWSPNGMFPGTAFTRSIGDSGALLSSLWTQLALPGSLQHPAAFLSVLPSSVQLAYIQHRPAYPLIRLCAAAEDIGVIPDPEVLATQLGPQHAFVVLATDGVWEFISSQKAVEIVAKHNNPYDGARSLVAQAYKLWLQRETRTDDISAVVLFFDWPEQEGGSTAAAPTCAAAAAATSVPQQPADGMMAAA
jgi:serine/threonine protein phosphatase PrpC